MEMKSGDWRWWLALRMVRGIGNITAISLVRTFGGPAEAMRASPHALACAGVRRPAIAAIRRFDAWGAVDEQLRKLDAKRAYLITWQDESYPECLRHIHDAPFLLFARGSLTAADRLAVAVVGSRAATGYGRRMARSISEGLARSGVTVVSGLARGIDAEAHAAALRTKGRTVAVLGCGIDVVYPSAHHRLQMAIGEYGAVLSEYPMGTPPDRENFPGRNRIISGLALGTVVVEAPERSGALLTAEFASQQGRDVFAVPGPVGISTQGTHALLRDGATLVESYEDVVREIAPHVLAEATPRQLPLLDGDDAKVFACIREPLHIDEVTRQSGLPVSRVLQTLLQLELRGLIEQLPGKTFARRSPGV